jgi:hypothetical protein
VSLVGARIGLDVDCSGGEFLNPGETAISLARAQVKGTIFFRPGSREDQGGGLLFKSDGVVDLEDTSAGSLRTMRRVGTRAHSLS